MPEELTIWESQVLDYDEQVKHCEDYFRNTPRPLVRLTTVYTGNHARRTRLAFTHRKTRVCEHFFCTPGERERKTNQLGCLDGGRQLKTSEPQGRGVSPAARKHSSSNMDYSVLSSTGKV